MNQPTATAHHPTPSLKRSGVLALGGFLMLIMLGGCASRVPSPALYVLGSAPPAGQAVNPPSPAGAAWQLMLPVRVPDYLDREALLLPQGQHGVRAAPDQRWAELLSSSVPRVLTQDLLALRGEGSLWSAPLPPGVLVRGQLRVALLAFDVNPGGTGVTLRARWTTAAATEPARAHTLTLNIPSAEASTDSLVGAHRLALWQLAQAIAKSLG